MKNQGMVSVWTVVFCTETERYLLGLRSGIVNNKNLWNVWGGSVDEGETLMSAARRELKEEAGLVGILQSLGSLVGKNTTMYFYLLLAPIEVKPSLDKETSKSSWFSMPKIQELGSKNRLHGPTAKLFKSSLIA